MKKVDKSSSAGTKDDSDSTVQDLHVSQPIAKPNVKRRSKLINEMKSIYEIKQALKDMEIRRSAACLDMCEIQPNGIKYDTDIIRRIESIDVTIYVLKWVLQPSKPNGV